MKEKTSERRIGGTKVGVQRRLLRSLMRGMGRAYGTNKLNKPSTLKRLWDLHKTVKFDDGTDDFSQHPDRLRSDARDLRRAEQNILNDSMKGQKDAAKNSTPHGC